MRPFHSQPLSSSLNVAAGYVSFLLRGGKQKYSQIFLRFLLGDSMSSELAKGNIRYMHFKDANRIAQLEQICFTMPWSRDAVIDDLNNNIAHYLVFELDGQVIAYAGMWLIIDEAHITNIAVDPAFRRRGLGKTMMLALAKEAVRKGASMMTLECRVSNIAAQKMYRNLGFDICGMREKYYHDNGEDAYVMWNKDIIRMV